MYNEKIRGNMIRSRIINYEQGEKPSKYFLNLEKHKQGKKTIYKLKNKQDIMLDTKKDILHEVHDFYRTLYMTDDCMTKVDTNIKQDFLPEISHIKLTDELKHTCEGMITDDELTEALKLTKNNKSPGIDGIPYEFYKIFRES